MIDEFEARILSLIDDMVEYASDDELFAGGYLRGHLTLAVAEISHLQNPGSDVLLTEVQNSLQKAIDAGELSSHDQALVLGMWDDLLNWVRESVE